MTEFLAFLVSWFLFGVLALAWAGIDIVEVGE
jgi:hypothetical protein